MFNYDVSQLCFIHVESNIREVDDGDNRSTDSHVFLTLIIIKTAFHQGI